jgi:hypothetical protein
VIDAEFEAAYARAARVSNYLQGEVFDLPDICLVLADAMWPLAELSRTIADEAGGMGLVVVPEPVDRVAPITQTCDLQVTEPDTRLCQVAPVIDRGETFAREAARGHRPGWVAVPWHSRSSVVDLSRITTIERSVLVEASSAGRPSTPADRLHLAETVSRHFTRAALPDHIVDVLRPVLKRMKDKHDKQSPEGRCIALVSNLRVEANPDLDHDAPMLTLLVVLEAADLPLIPAGTELDETRIDALVEGGALAAATRALEAADPVERREGWVALAELWTVPATAIAARSARVDSIDVQVLSGDELTFTRLRNAPELDLAYLSSRVA